MPCCQGAQCGVVSSHPRSGHVSCCILAWYIPEGGLVYGLLPKKVLYWQGICQSYALSRSGCTSHRTFPKLVSSWSQRCATETFSWPRIMRPTRRGAWIGRNYTCISRRNCCQTSILGHTGRGFKKGMFALLLLTKSSLGLPGWIRAGY